MRKRHRGKKVFEQVPLEMIRHLITYEEIQKAAQPDMTKARDLWISPRLNLRGRDGDRAWERSGNLTPGAGARFLELADIALGVKKPLGRKKKPAVEEIKNAL